MTLRDWHRPPTQDETRAYNSGKALCPPVDIPLQDSQTTLLPGGYAASGSHFSMNGSFVGQNDYGQVPPAQNLGYAPSYPSAPGSVISYQQPANWGYNNAPPPSTISFPALRILRWGVTRISLSMTPSLLDTDRSSCLP